MNLEKADNFSNMADTTRHVKENHSKSWPTPQHLPPPADYIAITGVYRHHLAGPQVILAQENVRV